MHRTHDLARSVCGTRFDEAELAENLDGAFHRILRDFTPALRRTHGHIGVARREEPSSHFALRISQRTVHLGHLIAVGSHLLERRFVDLGVFAGVEQMHARRSAVTPSAAAHLVKLDFVVGQMVKHHMADIGNVDAFAERRRGDERCQVTIAEHLLDARALLTRKACVVEADHERQLRHLAAQRSRERHRAGTGVDVHNRLLAAGHQVGKVVFARLRPATIVDVKVRAVCLVEHASLDGQLRGDVASDDAACCRGQREHGRIAEPFECGVELGVGRAVARFRHADVMGLVDDDEADAARPRQVVDMQSQELGSRQHDVARAVLERGVDGAPLLGRRLARKHARGEPESGKRVVQMEGLVGDERT